MKDYSVTFEMGREGGVVEGGGGEEERRTHTHTHTHKRKIMHIHTHPHTHTHIHNTSRGWVVGKTETSVCDGAC